MKILICGVSGSGKSTLAKPFAELIGGVYLGEEDISKQYNFTNVDMEYKMLLLSDGVVKAGKIAVVDCICAQQFERDAIAPDFVVWMDTLNAKDFPEFEKPTRYEYHVSAWFDDTHKQLMDVVTVWMQRNRE